MEENQLEDLENHVKDYHLKITIKGAMFDLYYLLSSLKEAHADNSQLEMHLEIKYLGMRNKTIINCVHTL